MKTKKVMDRTASRKVYNQARKRYLDEQGKIFCAICKYNRGENDTRKYYGTTRYRNGGFRFPNWKLCTKNKKQWMEKNLKFQDDFPEMAIWGWKEGENVTITW